MQGGVLKANLKSCLGETLKAEVCLFSLTVVLKFPTAGGLLPNEWAA